MTFTGDAAMAKSGRGTSEQYVLDGAAAAVSMVKWYDNKGILMASPLFGIEPEDERRRWSKKDKQHLEVKRPAVIERYKYMGGVDLCDRMISYHKMGARTRRWNLRVISHFIDLALRNCWIEGAKMQLYDFRESVALELINSVDESLSSSDSDNVQPPRGRVSALPAIVSRVITAKHLPVACDLPILLGAGKKAAMARHASNVKGAMCTSVSALRDRVSKNSTQSRMRHFVPFASLGQFASLRQCRLC